MNKRVHFPIETDPSSGLIAYPDEIQRFANADLATMPGHLIVDYAGALDLPVYVPPTQASLPLLVITKVISDQPDKTLVNLDRHEITCPQGATLTLTAELRGDDGQVLPYADSFRLPIRQRGGRDGLLIGRAVNGKVTVVAPFTAPGDDGAWQCDAAGINAGLPDDARLRFACLTVNVYRG
ncbi:hypothetical protein FNU76_23875 [Chitinimonas arctica]|uniref:Uncharacterized protein n=1 Tax=Chitinimonas arctica TaxID=2594795 RepID=A0A516SLU7_9NEIS|nr:hypothetical protein [Chitinimonas arctica]QDQ29144.1 hypothetical protein FNU76_23875 [Chitinimonas arctica]